MAEAAVSLSTGVRKITRATTVSFAYVYSLTERQKAQPARYFDTRIWTGKSGQITRTDDKLSPALASAAARRRKAHAADLEVVATLSARSSLPAVGIATTVTMTFMPAALLPAARPWTVLNHHTAGSRPILPAATGGRRQLLLLHDVPA